MFAEVSGWPSVSSIPQRLEGEPGHMPVTTLLPGDLLGQDVPPPNVTSRDGLLVNRHEGLVGVVVLVCLARVVFVGGVDRPRDVFAIRSLR